MSDPTGTAYTKEEQWRKDVRVFSFAVFKHWHWWTCTTISSGIAALWQGGGRMIPSWVLWLFALSGIVIAAFKTWQDQRRIAETKELELQNAVTKYADEKQQLFKQQQAKDSVNEDIIKALKAQLDGRAKRKEIEEKLTGYHTAIKNRAYEIKKMYDFEYAKKYQESYYQGQIDPDSVLLLNETAAFLDSNIGRASVVIFWDKTDLKMTPSNGLSTQESHWRAVMDNLNHHTVQIMKIIDIYIVNKGEIK
jgi:hypothetical protein